MQTESTIGDTTGSALARLFECLVQDLTLVDEGGQSDTLGGKGDKRVFALIKQKTTQQKIRASANVQYSRKFIYVVAHLQRSLLNPDPQPPLWVMATTTNEVPFGRGRRAIVDERPSMACVS